jgi:hypothetical protein
MIKQNWVISESEKKRIIFLHQNATKNHYLFEQKNISYEELKKFVEFKNEKPVQETKKFSFTFNFASGFWSKKSLNFDGTITIQQQVINLTKQIEQVLKTLHTPRITNIQISAGESAVKNRDNEDPERPYLNSGELANRRMTTINGLLSQIMTTLIDQGIIKTIPQINQTDPVIGTSTERNSEQAIKEQFVRVTVDIVGLKKLTPQTPTEPKTPPCDFKLKMVVEYQPVNDKDIKYHVCDEATFEMKLNGITIPCKETGKNYFTLNNENQGGKTGGARLQTMIVDDKLAKQILSISETPMLTFTCMSKTLNPESNECHESPMLMTIYSLDTNEVINEPTYLGTAKDKKDRMPEGKTREIARLDKCGKITKKILEELPTSTSETEKKSE